MEDLWINLPVKDIERSKAFFIKIGFELQPGPGNTEVSASLRVGRKKIVVMLFAEHVFKSFTRRDVPDSAKMAQTHFSLGATTREEVDAMAINVREAGGVLQGKPAESQGWMYGFGFSDLDGQSWNFLYCDFDKQSQ